MELEFLIQTHKEKFVTINKCPIKFLCDKKSILTKIIKKKQYKLLKARVFKFHLLT